MHSRSSSVLVTLHDHLYDLLVTICFIRLLHLLSDFERTQHRGQQLLHTHGIRHETDLDEDKTEEGGGSCKPLPFKLTHSLLLQQCTCCSKAI